MHYADEPLPCCVIALRRDVLEVADKKRGHKVPLGRQFCNLRRRHPAAETQNAVWTVQGQGVAQEGYKFLLRDAYSQLWVLLRRYIANR